MRIPSWVYFGAIFVFLFWGVENPAGMGHLVTSVFSTLHSLLPK